MSSPSHPPRAGGPGLREQVLRECTEMVRHALASGLRVPAQSIETVERARTAPPADGSDLAALTAAHARLAKLVAPATPRALLLFAEEGSRDSARLRLPGPIRLVRWMMVAAFVSVVLFIASSLSHYVNGDPGGMPELFGMPLFVNEVFWLASAGVGASFAMLFQVNEYIVDRSYDPKYEASYWIKFMIGVIAGFILVALVPVGGLEAAAAEGGEGAKRAAMLTKPTLAMLGGFSASAVYRILNRLMSTVEGLFRGDPREESALREQAAAQRADEEHAAVRLGVASRLVELRQQIAAGADPAALQAQLAALVSSLSASDGASPPALAGGAQVAGEAEPAPQSEAADAETEDMSAGDAAEGAPAPAGGAPDMIQVPAIVGIPAQGS